MVSVDSASIGKAVRHYQGIGRYIEFCKSTFDQTCNIAHLTIVVDCANGATYNIAQYVFMVSTEGGVEIEKVASETPEKIIKEWINPENGFTEKQGGKLAVKLGLVNGQISSAVDIFTSLWNVFSELNCSLLEINPLVVTSQEQVIALDAKMNLDSNGLFRHRELLDLRDKSEEDPAELVVPSSTKTEPTAQPTFNKKSAVIGGLPTTPLMPSVPKNFSKNYSLKCLICCQTVSASLVSATS